MERKMSFFGKGQSIWEAVIMVGVRNRWRTFVKVVM